MKSNLEKTYNFVYVTTNLVNGKQYVGDHSTDNLKRDNYLGSGNLIIAAKKKYGRKNFKREILEFFDTKQDAFNIQEKYIKFYNSHVSKGGYNISWKGAIKFMAVCLKKEKKKLGNQS